MSFERPLLFALLPLAALWIGWLEWRLPGGGIRRSARFVVRMLLLGVLVAALAGPYAPDASVEVPRLAIAVDRASRLSQEAQAEAGALAARAEAAARRAGMATVRIGFTTRAAAPGAEPPPSSRSAAATGLAGARLALGDARTGGIYLLSDGRGDLRGMRAAVEELRSDGFQVTAGAVPARAPPYEPPPALGRIDVPEEARGPFVVRASVARLAPHDAGRLALFVDGARVAAVPVGGAAGLEVRFDEQELPPGLYEIGIALEVGDGDQVATVAHARRLLDVGAPPRVTVLLRDAGSAPWRRALAGQGLAVSEATPETLGGVLGTLDALPDLVVADAVSLVALPPAAAVMLADQVRAGLGLVVDAGADDQAWAALAAGPLADLLPVTPQPAPEPPPPPPPPPQSTPEPPIDPPEADDGPGLKAERRPEKAFPISLLLVIDRSPSMEGAKFEMALEGARRAAMALSPWDRIGVITFARDASVDVPFRSARAARTRLPMWLSAIRTGGETTNIVRALQVASQAFAAETSPILHLLLLTDGRQYPPGPIFGPVVKPMRRRGITITAVGIGSGASMRDLRDIVQWAAAGRVVPVANEAELPTILTEDTRRLARERKEKAEEVDARLHPEDQEPDPAEPEADAPPRPPETREPTADAPPPPPAEDAQSPPLPMRLVRRHEALAGLEQADLPRVGAPQRSVLRPEAALLLERESDQPVLAAARGGIGRVLAWTLPPKDAGMRDWPRTGALLAQIARSALAPRGSLGFLPTAAVTQGPDGAFLHVAWPAGTSSGRLEATWIGPGGRRVSLGTFTPDDSAGRALPEAPPDALCRIEMTVPGAPDLPNLSYAVPRPRPAVPQAGDVQSLERILDAPLDTPEAFVASLRSRRLPERLPRWPWFLWLALALLPLDVWLHRRSRPA